MEPGHFLRKPFPAVLAVVLFTFTPPRAPARAETPTARQLHQQAVAAYARIDTYIARYVQRDPPGNKEDILDFYFRKKPWSVRFQWLNGDGQGREVLYVQGQPENKIHVILAAGDIPFLPAGRMMSLTPDSPLVKRASRTPITHAGIGALIDRFGQALDAEERGDAHAGRTTVKGVQKRPDYDTPLLMTEQVLPPGADPDLPNGGRLQVGFHTELHLPVLASLRNEYGVEVDYYRFDRLQLHVSLNDADFDPVRMRQRHQPAPTDRGGPNR
jgi:hypothetical protein